MDLKETTLLFMLPTHSSLHAPNNSKVVDEWKTKEENIDRKLRYRIKGFQ